MQHKPARRGSLDRDQQAAAAASVFTGGPQSLEPLGVLVERLGEAGTEQAPASLGGNGADGVDSAVADPPRDAFRREIR